MASGTLQELTAADVAGSLTARYDSGLVLQGRAVLDPDSVREPSSPACAAGLR